ncbi:hypothetical protein BD830_105236 [Maritimibacter alkaliphilus HTCC2654]|uniref:Uncharacterized protein n=1 Tax=Maritimibacter alkaliphilus HTCC2654 TaxID=314271 RepID=A3VLE2_9RHOB|nr:hypothetical protein [Maritimibacter alkaliphilus]EAQ10947.1 hypothetical protein RB2654_04969 [Rhodobacterales bacterium HTCC2654] [Maritimibacter alkaliphilus HTCC2654]TYP81569.1 hypothetical protein BD830_105236 [Maritimibacter alkaliphilus HTCC2654]
MQVTLEATTDASCTLKQTTPSQSVSFTLPVAKDVLLDGLVGFLAQPEVTESQIDDIMVTQNRDGIFLHAGGGKFHLSWPFAIALAIEA